MLPTTTRYYVPESRIAPAGDASVSLRQMLAEVAQSVAADSYPTNEPALELPYDSESQMRNVYSVAKAFASAIGTGDKKRERVAVVYGISGAGKTRFAKELPELLKQACTHPQEVQSLSEATETANPVQPSAVSTEQTSSPPSNALQQTLFINKIRSLQTALTTNCKRVYTEWRHNGQAYSDIFERNWPSSVRLGLRVAAQYWFPNVNFMIFRERLWNSPHLLNFTLFNVLNAMHQEDNTISAVYITLDEFQTTTQFMVPAESTNIGNTTEPLSRTLARALASSARMASGKFFVFGTLAGTSLAAEDIVHEITDDTFVRVPVQRLSSQNVRNIISRVNLNGYSGTDWLALKGFGALIKIAAGIPRTVELLVEEMKAHNTLPASIDIELWRTAIFNAYKRKFNTAAVFGGATPKTWPLLLGAAGYNVSYLGAIAGTQDAPLTLRALEQVGFFTCVDKPPTSAWEKYYTACHLERAITVLDVPLPLLTMMDQQNRLQIHCPNPARTFSEAEVSVLKSQLKPLVYDIYLNSTLLEKVVLAHLVLRWNVFNFADSNKHILAADLFVGGIFRPEFGALKFIKEKTVIGFTNNPARGVWATVNRRGRRSKNDAKEPPPVKDSVELTHGAVLKFSDMSPLTRGVIFSGTNLFDSHVRLWIRDGKKKRLAILWLDAKHTSTGSTDLTSREVNQIVNKRKFLEENLPQYMHLAVIYSNREYNGKVPTDPYTCIITRDGMSFSMSPFMKWLLVDNI